jgi:Ni,Fe-hydrogenase III large subunit
VTTTPGTPITIPIGPQHPLLKEPLAFLLTVEGERIVDSRLRIGYVHRGIERLCQERTYVQNLHLFERVCGICSHVHTTAYCQGVEALLGVQVPARGLYLRALLCELERVHSHLLWLGVAAHEAGFDTLFMYSWRDRETVMDLLEKISGNRVNYSANLLGGVKFDISPKQADEIHQGLDFLEGRTRHYLDVVSSDALFLQRTRGVGGMTRAQAEVLGAVGPTARASGVKRDIRVEAPYGAYLDFPVEVVLESAGDLEARFAVRMRELQVSYDLVRAVLAHLPEGELEARLPRRIKPGEAISRVEAPRGELFYFIKSNGSDRPERIKVRTPTIMNMTSVVKLAVGHQLADIPMILAGIDPCFSCNDRCVMIRRPGQAHEIVEWETFRKQGQR